MNKGKHLLKKSVSKAQCNCTTDINFVILYNTNDILYHCTIKNKIPIAQRSSVVYQVTCLDFLKGYVGKTEFCFHIGKDEHGRKSDQPMHRHLFGSLLH